MVLGSVVFAALRRASLPLLLFFSTLAVGAGYLGMAAAPTLARRLRRLGVGGAGNGVQWVAVISAVQELTAAIDAGAGDRRARIDRLRRCPGIGYVLGGLIATGVGARARLPRRRRRGDRHRPRGGAVAGHDWPWTDGHRGPVGRPMTTLWWS